MNVKVVNGLIKNNINSKSGQKRFVNNIKWFQENNPGKSPWDAIFFVCEPQRAYLQDDASDEEFMDSLKYFCDMLLKNDSWKKLFNVNEELKEEESIKENVCKVSSDKMSAISDKDPDFIRWATDKYNINIKKINDHDGYEITGSDDNLDKFIKDYNLNEALNEAKYSIALDGDVPENLTEAPDDDGIMSDDELDAEEQRERDEFEARMKARRDKVAQQRAERDAKVAKEQELKAKADEIIAQIGNDWSFENLFDLLVPGSGKCDTLAGEIIRAINKIEYRWFNDGDRWFEDYGIETAGPAAKFLMNVEIDDETPFWDAVLISAENNYDDSDYDKWVEGLKNLAEEIIKANPTLLAKETSDMLDIDYRDVERWLDDEGLVPTYETDADIPSELDAHLEKGNISERDIQWEVESWCENAGCYNASVEVNGDVYIDGLNKAAYDELDGNLYRWLEQYAEDLTEEYGDPYEEDSSDWAESIADELGQDVDMVQNVLDTHKFDSYDDALEYVKELIEEEAEEDSEEETDESLEEATGYDHYGAKEMEPFKGPAYIQYDGGPRQIDVLTKAKNHRWVWKNKAGVPDDEWYIFPSFEDALKVQKEVGGEIMSWNQYAGIKDEPEEEDEEEGEE